MQQKTKTARACILGLPMVASGLACGHTGASAHGAHHPAGHAHAEHAAPHGPPGEAHSDHEQPAMEHRFEGAERWSAVWDAAERDGWQKPDAVLRALALPQDARVADIGAGTGYFTMRLAAAVPAGVVYAVDVEPDMVAFLRQRAAQDGRSNVEAVLASASDARLPTPVDLIFVCNTYHHISERSDYFRRLRQSLEPGGRLAIVDYKKDAEGPGPPAHHRMSAAQVVDELRHAGYVPLLVDEHSLPFQYVIVLSVEGESP